MVAIVQLVRTPGCGPGGRGFKSHWSPKEDGAIVGLLIDDLIFEGSREFGISEISFNDKIENYQMLPSSAPIV